MSDLLEIRLRHRFAGGFELDAALEISTGRPVTGLFGPSGAGKTSILMAVAGHLSPDSGRVRWRGRTLFDADAGIDVAPEDRRVGMVFQDPRLFPHMSVADNLRYGARRRPSGVSSPPLDDVVDVLDLGGLIDRSPGTLSGGERQRAALGRTLISGPEILLLDEPVAAVDEPRRGSILDYVERSVSVYSIPAVYVSHQRIEVQRLADWVVALSDGRVVEEGPPERVLGGGAKSAVGGEPVNLLRLVRPHRTGPGRWRADVPGLDGVALTIHVDADAEVRFEEEVGHDVPGDDASRPLYVQFSPSDVMLATAGLTRDPTGPRLSARNVVPGTVTELVPREGWIYVAVSLEEQSIWAEVTPAAARELELEVGLSVVCLLKAAAIRVVG